MPTARTTILATATLAFVSASPAQAEVLLRWNLTPGTAFVVSFQQEMKMETTLAGQELFSEADLGIALLWKVQDVSPIGESQIEQTIERIQLGMTSPGYNPVSYDSNASDTPQPIAETIGKAVQPLLGLAFVQRMDAQGRIHEVRLADDSTGAVAQASAGAQLNQAFSQDGLRDLLTQAAATLPEHAVNPGDQWAARSAVDSAVGKLLMDITYTYRGAELQRGRQLERIDVAMQMRFEDGPNAMAMQVQIPEQACSGVVYFDNVAGRIASSEITRHVVTETRIGDQTHRHVVDTDLRLELSDPTSTKMADQSSTLAR